MFRKVCLKLMNNFLIIFTKKKKSFFIQAMIRKPEIALAEMNLLCTCKEIFLVKTKRCYFYLTFSDPS